MAALSFAGRRRLSSRRIGPLLAPGLAGLEDENFFTAQEGTSHRPPVGVREQASGFLASSE